MISGSKGRMVLAFKLLAAAYALFLMMFSLDALGEGAFLEQALGFIVHSLPSILILAAMAVFWRKPWLLGSALIAVALYLTLRFRLYEDGLKFAIMSLPPLIAGLGLVIAGRRV